MVVEPTMIDRELIFRSINKDVHNNNNRKYCIYIDVDINDPIIKGNEFMFDLMNSYPAKNDNGINLCINFSGKIYKHQQVINIGKAYGWQCIEISCDDLESFLNAVNKLKVYNKLPTKFDIVMIYGRV